MPRVGQLVLQVQLYNQEAIVSLLKDPRLCKLFVVRSVFHDVVSILLSALAQFEQAGMFLSHFTTLSALPREHLDTMTNLELLLLASITGDPHS